jgi:laccase
MVDHGKTYLLRIINAAMNADLFLAIANHTLTVVGTDGNYVKPLITDYLEISPGQTLNVLVTANQPLGHYYLAVRQFYTDKMLFTEYDKVNATAILMYSGNYTAPDHPVFPSNLPVYVDIQAAETFLHRLKSLASEEHPAKVPLNPTTRMFITVSMNEIQCPNASCDGIDGNKMASSLNNISFVNPTTDVLQAYYK